MPTSPVPSQQTIVIPGASSEPSDSRNHLYTTHSASSASKFLDDMISSESRILINTLSSVPVIWQWELSQKYYELGEALSEMTALEGADEWKIDSAVYDAARYVAAGLRADSLPAPRVFSHGPKSVVFNWSHEADNLYLTVSSNKISALISSPQRIKWRIEISANESLNPAKLRPFIRSANLEGPVILLSSAVSDLPEFFGGY